jgi:serine/threonine protein kinase
MLVLEYCEHGTLLDHVKDATTHSLDTSMLLTYCHDVASGTQRPSHTCGTKTTPTTHPRHFSTPGMHYLSSRRIVHRDIAARNVLLDGAFSCKGQCSAYIRPCLRVYTRSTRMLQTRPHVFLLAMWLQCRTLECPPRSSETTMTRTMRTTTSGFRARWVMFSLLRSCRSLVLRSTRHSHMAPVPSAPCAVECDRSPRVGQVLQGLGQSPHTHPFTLNRAIGTHSA